MFLRKLEKHLTRGLFYEGCGIIDHSLGKVKIKTQTLSWKSPEGVDYSITR